MWVANFAKSKQFIIIVTVTFTVLSAALVISFFIPSAREQLLQFAAANTSALPLLIIVSKFLAIVIPPVSGGWVSLASIPYLGWLPAMLIDTLSGIAALSLTFYLGRKYKQRLVSRFVKLGQFEAYSKLLSGRQQYWTIFAIRIAGSLVFDFLSYAIGLTNVRFRTYLAAIIPAGILNNLLSFYLFSLGFTEHPLFFLVSLLPMVGLAAIFKKFLWKRPA